MAAFVDAASVEVAVAAAALGSWPTLVFGDFGALNIKNAKPRLPIVSKAAITENRLKYFFIQKFPFFSYTIPRKFYFGLFQKNIQISIPQAVLATLIKALVENDIKVARINRSSTLTTSGSLALSVSHWKEVGHHEVLCCSL
jgi:hypothetical protein